MEGKTLQNSGSDFESVRRRFRPSIKLCGRSKLSVVIGHLGNWASTTLHGPSIQNTRRRIPFFPPSLPRYSSPPPTPLPSSVLQDGNAPSCRVEPSSEPVRFGPSSREQRETNRSITKLSDAAATRQCLSMPLSAVLFVTDTLSTNRRRARSFQVSDLDHVHSCAIMYRLLASQLRGWCGQIARPDCPPATVHGSYMLLKNISSRKR